MPTRVAFKGVTAFLVAALHSGCGGEASPAPPGGLTYKSNPATYTVGIPITSNVPNVSGGPVASWSVAPALPSGLILDGVTGVILGTPNVVASAATYIVTARNSGGATTTGVSLTVYGSTFTATGNMTTGRRFHTATLLPNGKVLVAGGINSGPDLASAELYDPVARSFAGASSMMTARSAHTATLMPTNGKVLIAGGFDPLNEGLASAELYDPVTGAFSITGSMSSRRGYHTATLLPNGKVLLVGGRCSLNGTLYCGVYTAELYDPVTETFSPTGGMVEQRAGNTATLLPNGKVLIAGGGVDPTAELYDPVLGTFTATGSLLTVRYSHTATLLPDGHVLVAGGFTTPPTSASLAELYDPIAGIFEATGNMVWWNQEHSATLLPDGKVLVAGGRFEDAELYNPVEQRFSVTGRLSQGRLAHTATLLPDGTVLFAGGELGRGAFDSAELCIE